MTDRSKRWEWMDWVHPTTDVPHAQYTAVAALPKPALLYEPITATVTFRAQVATAPGTYYSMLEATADGTPLSPVTQAAPVHVIDVVSRLFFPLILKSETLEGVASTTESGESRSMAGVPAYSILTPPQVSPQSVDRLAGLRPRRIPLPGSAALAVAVDDGGTRAFVSRVGGQLDVLQLATGAIERTLALPVNLDALVYDPAACTELTWPATGSSSSM